MRESDSDSDSIPLNDDDDVLWCLGDDIEASSRPSRGSVQHATECGWRWQSPTSTGVIAVSRHPGRNVLVAVISWSSRQLQQLRRSPRRRRSRRR